MSDNARGHIQGEADASDCDEKKLDGKKAINAESLLAAGLITGDKAGIKLLSKGAIKAGVTIEVDKASAAAVAAVEKAGGKVVFPAAKPAKTETKKAAKK